MANPLARLTAGGKRALVVVVIVLLVVSGLGATFASRLTPSAVPASAGLTVAASALAAPPAVPAADCAQAGPVGQELLDVLVLQLDEAWQKSDWKTAIAALSTIVAADPANAAARDRLYQAHVNLGWVLLVNQKPADANAEFSLALQIKPGGAEALEGLRLVERLGVTTTSAAAPVAAAVQVTCVPAPTPTPAAAVACVTQPAAQAVTVVSAPVQAVSTSGFVSHVVRTGDTLFGLARRFNTTVEAIIAANNLKSCTIFICQTLLIPVGKTVLVPPCPTICPVTCPVVSVPAVTTACVATCPPGTVRVHVVKRGDSLFRLALQFNTSVSLLMKVNGLTTTAIRVGQTLIIP